MVSSPNKEKEAQLVQPKGQKTIFLINSATKMALLTAVSGSLSQHQELISSQNEGIEVHLMQQNGRILKFFVKSATKMAQSIKTWSVRSVGINPNIRIWLAVLMKGLKTV